MLFGHLLRFVCSAAVIRINLCTSESNVSNEWNNHNLPVLDLRETDAIISSKLYHAATTVGFFYLVGHNVSIQLQRSVFQQSGNFFALNHKEKQKYKQSQTNNGYTAFEDETLDQSVKSIFTLT